MRLGRVIGEVVSTVKHPALVRWKLLLVGVLTPEGEPTGEETIALDAVEAGIGDHVLLHDEGAGASQIMENPRGPVRTMIVGVVDRVDREEV
jgi:ethanolamine utilization protein EutN